MNPEQQHERFTAVSRIEQRLDDLETVVEGLAQEMVTDRDALRDLLPVAHRLNTDLGTLSRIVGDMQADRDRRIAAWEALTLWQRLRWLVRGTA